MTRKERAGEIAVEGLGSQSIRGSVTTILLVKKNNPSQLRYTYMQAK
jgi:hypothetical protein